MGLDPVSGNVYVVDHGNHRVNIFDSEGVFLSSFGAGGSGAGQFDGPTGLAVDRDPQSASYRDVYVVDVPNGRVEKFDSSGNFILAFSIPSGGPIATGPEGIVYLGGNESVRKYKPSGEFLESIALGPYGGVISLAVDSAGTIYAVTEDFPAPGIHKYSPTGKELLGFGPPRNITTITVDGSGNVFDAEFDEEVRVRVIGEYGSAGEEKKRFGYKEIDENIFGLAVTAAGNRVYASEEYVGAPSPGNRALLIDVPPPGPLSCCPEASPIGSTKATLKGGVNPEGKSTTYHFEYVDDATYEADIAAEGPGHGFDHAKKTAESGSVGSDFKLHPAEGQVGCPDPISEAGEGKCLTPQTVYHYRIVVTNADGESSAEGQLETKQSPEITATWATEVGPDAARLHATVDPQGVPASGYFEYVDDGAFQASGFAGASRVPAIAEAQLDFGSEGAVSRSAQATSLSPGTLYHYRLVASNVLTTVQGPERTFSTFPLPSGFHPCGNEAFRSGAAAGLPDCRAYEMVSPVDKNGGDIEVLGSIRGFPAGLDQPAVGGDRITYSSATAFAGALSAPYTSQYTATREAGKEWRTEPISAPRSSNAVSDDPSIKLDSEYKAFAGDLESGWLMHTSDPPLNSCAPAGFANIYRREESGGYEAISSAEPANQPAGGGYWPELQGVSADGTHAVFDANAKLTGNASSVKDGAQPILQLYEHVRGKGCGKLQLVSVLPNGQASSLPSTVGTRNSNSKEAREDTVARAVSADGSRIFWTAAPGTGTGPGALYVRINGKETDEISPGPARFWTASTDGSKAFYTLEGELLEYNVNSKAQIPIAGETVGVAEASEDGSRLYFVSKEALGGEGEAGKPNLYLRRAGTSKLVATLSGDDLQGGAGSAVETEGFTVATKLPNEKGTRTTPDGEHLAFISNAPLTGYDNTDASDGRSDFELYLYDAATGKLACVSCNPSRARPEGRKYENEGETIRVAAKMARTPNDLYAPHNLSDDGNRLFFDSFDALVPRDGNGMSDVYEWERAANQAECDAKGAELFVKSAGGCLSLITSGQSSADSSFVDATPDGHDAFFKTGASLLPQDPGLVDIYDARVDGGLPGPVGGKSPCEGEACQTPPPPPEDPTPSSSTFHGPEPKASARCPKGKHKVKRAGKKPHCVAKHKHKRHAKRADHKGRAGR